MPPAGEELFRLQPEPRAHGEPAPSLEPQQKPAEGEIDHGTEDVSRRRHGKQQRNVRIGQPRSGDKGGLRYAG